MAARTHYETLGVARDASSVDIAAAFRDKLAALKADPRATPAQVESLKEAYQTLATPVRRENYDETLPPTPAQRREAARQLVEEKRAEEAGDGPDWRGKAAKLGVPIVLVAIVAWGVFQKFRAPPPLPRIVSMTTMTIPAPPEPAAEEPAEGEPRRAVASSPAPAGSIPPGSPEELFSTVSASIVRVFAGDPAKPSKQGSGVVIEAARVVTNCHVVAGGGRITVKAGLAAHSATVRVADEERDLCVLDVPGLDAPAVPLGTVANLRVGQRVYAIGAPLGLELTLSEGIVSSLRVVPEGKVIQTTAPVSPGSSGGGLFDTRGELVGIVTFQSRDGQNLNFAVPVDWLADLRDRKSASPAAVASAPVDVPITQRVSGTWWCFGTMSGRNSVYDYGRDGILRLTNNDGRPDVVVPYRVVGQTIQYTFQGQVLSLRIESISEERMVLFVQEGQRLACERR